MTTPQPPERTVQSPETVRKALRAVKDPELNLNIIDIGLVYDVEASEEGDVKVKMTLTSPGCPAGGEIIEDVQDGGRVISRACGTSRSSWCGIRTGPPRRWILGCAPSWASEPLSSLPRRLAPQRRQQLFSELPQLPAPQLRHAAPARRIVFGSTRAIASSVPLGQTTPGGRSYFCASRLRAALSRSSRAS